MLYMTTTEKDDAYTAARTFYEDRGPDGGLFVPRQLPVYAVEQLKQLEALFFGQRIAQILNGFFGTKLTGWDVDSAIGRCPVKVHTMSHRILFAELWQNLDGDYSHLERTLAEMIRCDGDRGLPVSSWLRISVRIAVLFALFSELVRVGELSWDIETDVSVHGGDLSAAVAVWYARIMGLPVGNIICGCNENCVVWDLLHHGEMKTDAAPVSTATPLADVSLPPELERLIYGTLGREQTQRYLLTCQRRGLYVPPAESFEQLRKGMFVAVVSRARVEVLIPSVYRTNRYLMGPYTALAYGGLMDYRAKTGESRPALLLAERAPKQDAALVAVVMGLTEQQIPGSKD